MTPAYAFLCISGFRKAQFVVESKLAADFWFFGNVKWKERVGRPLADASQRYRRRRLDSCHWLRKLERGLEASVAASSSKYVLKVQETQPMETSVPTATDQKKQMSCSIPIEWFNMVMPTK
jgi:hypothetical protein